MKIQRRRRFTSNLMTHTAWGVAIHHWISLLWKHRFRIQWRSVPKVLLITANAMLQAPLQCFEYFRFRKAINGTRVQRPVFIIGHFRSGTTHLHYLLSKDSDLSWCSTYAGLTPNTFLTLGGITKIVLGWMMPRTRPQDQVETGAGFPLEEEFAMANMSSTSLVHGYYFPQSLQQTFDEHVLFKAKSPGVFDHWKQAMLFLVKKLVYQSGGKRIVLKSPANTGRIKEILELFPDALFIHLHRNPYDVYVSTVNLYEKILPVLGLQRVESQQLTSFVLYAYEQMYRKYLKERSLIPPGQLIECSYDQLVKTPLDTLRKIYLQLALGPIGRLEVLLESEIKSSRNFRQNRYDPPGEDALREIRARWQFAFEAFGYPL